jgi:hypothetical protein
MDKKYFDRITSHHPERQDRMVRESVLCDGECGKSFLPEDLEKNCYKQRMCSKCMFTFLSEQEDYIEINKGD